MKKTYRPYSAVVLMLKAAALPALIGLVDSYSSSLTPANEYIDSISSLAKALIVAATEIVFLFLVGLISKVEIWDRKRSIKSGIGELEALLPAPNRKLATEITKKIKIESIFFITYYKFLRQVEQ